MSIRSPIFPIIWRRRKFNQYLIFINHTSQQIGWNQNAALAIKALLRSSLVCAAEMQILALDSSNGVAGNATVTTASCLKYTDF